MQSIILLDITVIKIRDEQWFRVYSSQQPVPAPTINTFYTKVIFSCLVCRAGREKVRKRTKKGKCPIQQRGKELRNRHSVFRKSGKKISRGARDLRYAIRSSKTSRVLSCFVVYRRSCGTLGRIENLASRPQECNARVQLWSSTRLTLGFYFCIIRCSSIPVLRGASSFRTQVRSGLGIRWTSFCGSTPISSLGASGFSQRAFDRAQTSSCNESD